MASTGNAGPVVKFIGIGMGKAGTSWLHDMLMQHPQIFLPPQKEVQFFNSELPENMKIKNPNYTKGLGWYESFFSNAGKYKICGEFSPVYWISENAAKDIYEYNPNALLISTLRKPEDFLISNYLWRVRRGTIANIPFDEALKKYGDILWRPVQYYRNMQRYLEYFGEEQIEVVLFDQLKAEPESTLARVANRIGVEQFEFSDVNRASNVGAAAAHPNLVRSFRVVRTALKKAGLDPVIRATQDVRAIKILKRTLESTKSLETKPTISNDLRNQIADVTRPELEKLGAVLKIDFSHWWH